MNDTTKKQIEDFSLKIWGKNRTLEEKKLILQMEYKQTINLLKNSMNEFKKIETWVKIISVMKVTALNDKKEVIRMLQTNEVSSFVKSQKIEEIVNFAFKKVFA